MLDKWVKENVKVRLTKGNTVILPKHLREINNIVPGKDVIISVVSGHIYIKSKQHESLENQVIVSATGAIYIPVEIRRCINLQHGVTFEVYTSDNDKTIKLVPIQ